MARSTKRRALADAGSGHFRSCARLARRCSREQSRVQHLAGRSQCGLDHHLSVPHLRIPVEVVRYL
jgi:hypothetical protein